MNKYHPRRSRCFALSAFLTLFYLYFRLVKELGSSGVSYNLLESSWFKFPFFPLSGCKHMN